MISGVVIFLLATLWAAVELLSRYKEEPHKVMYSSPYCYIYLAGHGLIGLSCYFLLYTYLPDLPSIAMVCIASLGASMFLRSRLFDIRNEDRTFQVGPAFLVDESLRIVDRQIERNRADYRLNLVTKLMSDLNFEDIKAKVRLLVIKSATKLSDEQKVEFDLQLDAIGREPEFQGANQCFALGFVILDMTGEKFFVSLIRKLKELDRQ